MSKASNTRASAVGVAMSFGALALAAALAGCATHSESLTTSEVKTKQESAIVAIALSVHENEAEELHIVDSADQEKSLSLVRPTAHLAGEDVFLYELDPKKSYTVVSLHKGHYRTKMPARERAQFKVEPGTITYLCSYMLYQRDNFAEAVTHQATKGSAVSKALMSMFPDRKFRFGAARASLQSSARDNSAPDVKTEERL